MPATPLPMDPAAEFRRAVVVRGVAWWLAGTLAIAALSFRLDAAFELAGPARVLLLAAWVGLAALLGWLVLLRPLGARPRTPRATATARAAGLAGCSAILVFAPLALAAGSPERVRRVLTPWANPAADAGFTIVVPSGDTVIRRGSAITLAAYLDRSRPDAPLPTTASLVLRDSANGTLETVSMVSGDGFAFRHTLPAVTAEFTYRIEAGPIRSGWQTVAVADPVGLTHGTTLTLRPPSYLEREIAPIASGWTDLAGIRYSRVVIGARFDRPVLDAAIEFHSHTEPTLRMTTPIRLDPDKLGGTADLVLPANGTLTLSMVGDRGIRSENSISVRMRADSTPTFHLVVGLSPGPRVARIDDRIPMEIAVADDFRIERVRVEYCINGNESDVRSEPVRLAGIGSNRVAGSFTFALVGKVKEGDRIGLRVRAWDHRSIPGAKLGPQSAVAPASGWAELRISASTRPLAEQEILGQRDSTRTRLRVVNKLIEEAANELRSFRDALGDGPLPLDQAIRLRTVRERVIDAGKRLDELAVELALTPDLRPLAEVVRGQSGGLARVLRAVKQLEPEVKSGRETAGMQSAIGLSDVATTISRIDGLVETISRARLDRVALVQLAEDLDALADRPSDGETGRLRADLAGRLSQTLANSDLLRGAVLSATGEEVRVLAERNQRFAGDYAKWQATSESLELRFRTNRLAELLHRQNALESAVKEFAERSEPATRLAGTGPLPMSPFQAARALLTAGDPVAALTEQEKGARELDRVAEALSRSATARADSREAARQIARWQDDFRGRLVETAKRSPTAKLPDTFVAEQRLIGDAVGLLEVESDRPQVDTARVAIDHAIIAIPGSSTSAIAAVTNAANLVGKLADAIPTLAERMKVGRTRLDQLRKDQDQLGKDADATTADPTTTNWDGLADRQTRLAERVRRTDLPGLDRRRNRVAAAAMRAAADLRGGYRSDVPASQAGVRRELERFRQAVDGVTPADDLAVDLAHVQRNVAELAAGFPPRPSAEQLATFLKAQRDVTRRLAGLITAEGTGLLFDAREATLTVEAAAKPGAKATDLHGLATSAAIAITLLAERLTDDESDLARLERFTRERTIFAERAAIAARKPPEPGASAAAALRVQFQLDDFEFTRTGRAEVARAKAVDALVKLKQSADPDRQPGLQQAAADALGKLVSEVAKAGDRSVPLMPIGSPLPNVADELRRLSAGGRLPSEADAEVARALAKTLRTLRDDGSTAAVDLARGPWVAHPSTAGVCTDAEQLLKQLRELLVQANQLHVDLRDAAGLGAPDSASARAAQALAGAIEKMTMTLRESEAGRAERAVEARRDVAARLRQAVADAIAAIPKPVPPQVAAEVGLALRRADRLIQRPVASPADLRIAADALALAADRLLPLPSSQ